MDAISPKYSYISTIIQTIIHTILGVWYYLLNSSLTPSRQPTSLPRTFLNLVNIDLMTTC